MSTFPRELKPLPILALLFLSATLAGLIGCGKSPTPASLHDTKYAFIGVDGQPADTAEAAYCVLDRFTGLLWEIKDDRPGLRYWENTYTWYDPDEAVDPELDYRGKLDGGRCSESACDTWNYVQAVNEQTLCGADDWRMPKRDELGTISDVRKLETPPTGNLEFFPRLKAEEYWSVNDYSLHWDAAWVWNFRYGHDRVDWKHAPKKVRLVRGEMMLEARLDD